MNLFLIGIFVIILLIFILSLVYIRRKRENYKNTNICSGNGVYDNNNNCICKTQEMLVRYNNQEIELTDGNIDNWLDSEMKYNFVKRDIPLYTGKNCEKPVSLTQLTFKNSSYNPIIGCDNNDDCTFTNDSSNPLAYDIKYGLHSNDIPLDFSTQNINVLKICPFHNGLIIRDLKINKGNIYFLEDIYPLGQNTGLKDVNNCKVIYQGYSGWPLTAIPYATMFPNLLHMGGIDCDFTLIGKYNTDEEWSVKLNVTRDGFDITEITGNLTKARIDDHNLNTKVTYKDTGIEYDNYYVKNGTFDTFGAIGIGNISRDSIFPSMVVIGEPNIIYNTQFEINANKYNWEMADQDQIYTFLIDQYVLPCTKNILPWTEYRGWFFTGAGERIGTNVLYIVPWEADNKCGISKPDIYAIKNFKITSENTKVQNYQVYMNGAWDSNPPIESTPELENILSWIKNVKGIIIYTSQASLRYTGIENPTYSISFDIGTDEAVSTDKSKDIPPDMAKNISVMDTSSCNNIFVIPYDGVTFVDFSLTHGYSYGVYDALHITPTIITQYTGKDGYQVPIDKNYVFTASLAKGLDVNITVQENIPNQLPLLYEINIKANYCALNAGTITVNNTNNFLIQEATYVPTSPNPGVVVIGPLKSTQLTTNISWKYKSLKINSKDLRYDYIVSQPGTVYKNEDTADTPGFVFFTPKINVQQACVNDSYCSNNGQCKNYKCVCNSGWSGDRCEIKS